MSTEQCKNPEIGKLLFHYEMGQLEEADRSRFEEHLLECDFCAWEVETMFPWSSVLVANRDAVRKALQEEGVTLEALKAQLIPQMEPPHKPSMIDKIKEALVKTLQIFENRKVLWPALGTAVGMALLATVVYFVGSSREHGGNGPYRPLLSFQALPYSGATSLRGESMVEGEDLYNKGMEYYLQADYGHAAKYLKLAVAKSSGQGQWWLYLGVCYYLQRDSKPAIKALDRADEVANGGVKVRARWFLAQACLLQGDRDRAEPLLEWIVSQKKDFSGEASDLLNRLRSVGSVDSSDGDKPSLLFPEGGELFLTGSTISISWNDDQATLAKRYQIWLSTDGGITFPVLLASDVSRTETSWEWTDANTIGNRLSLRVNVVRDEGVVNGVRSKSFSITPPPRLAVQVPARGARWRWGIPKTISWMTAGTAPLSYMIELYRLKSSEMELVATLADGVPGSATTWAWKDAQNPDDAPEPGEHFRLKLIGVFAVGKVEEWSDGEFALAPLAVVAVDSITNENGIWSEGDNVPLAWTCTQGGATSHTVQLCISKTVEGTTLAEGLPGNANGWNWSNAGPPGSYYVRVITHFPEGDVVGYAPARLDIQPRSDLAHVGAAPEDRIAKTSAQGADVSLNQNYPNPFNATTTISFDLKTAGNVRLSVYNTLGQKVAALVDGQLGPGQHQAHFDGARLASGMYIYRLEVGGQVIQKQMMLTK